MCYLLRFVQKLRPFFPPLSSLQSLNLRTALLRSLTELKKNGILGRDVLLRKTMLDECKGEKFEELLSTFAMIVLRKSAEGTVAIRNVSISSNRSLHHTLQIRCLTLAYRSTLQQALRKRQDLTERGIKYGQTIQRQQQILAHRKQNLSRQVSDNDEACIEHITHVVEGNWTGDKRWVEVLLNGGHIAYNDDQTIENTDLLDGRAEDILFTPSSHRLVKELQYKLTCHKERVRAWKSFRESFHGAVIGEDTSTQELDIKATSSAHSFRKHKDINFDNAGCKDINPSKPHAPYDRLLENLQREMSARTKSKVCRSRSNTEHPEKHNPTLGGAMESARQETATIGETLEMNIAQNSSSTDDEANSLQKARIANPPTYTTDNMLSSPTELHADNTKFVTPANVLSLAERTRLSLKNMRTDRRTSPEASLECEPVFEMDRSDTERSGSSRSRDIVSNSSSLVERTRLSLSFASHSSSKTNKRRSKSSRLSQMYPVNPFETPRRQLQKETLNSPTSGGSTPKEQLFDESAEYASVFKSRPRIALSPMLSPNRSTFDMDSVLGKDIEQMDLSDEEEL